MLFSPHHQQQQQKLHETTRYGSTGKKYGHLVSTIIDKLEIGTVLDYGAGKHKSLTETLKPSRPITYQAYDCGVPGMADPPVPAELVCCIDVLEHIEPECLEDVLDHLEELTQRVAFISINTAAAGKTLPDGRNAHLIQRPMEWWFPKIVERFKLQTLQAVSEREFYVIVQNSGLALGD